MSKCVYVSLLRATWEGWLFCFLTGCAEGCYTCLCISYTEKLMDAVKRTNIYLTEQHIEQLRQAEQQTGLPQAEHVRRALDFYFDFRERLERLEAQMAELLEMHTPGN